MDYWFEQAYTANLPKMVPTAEKAQPSSKSQDNSFQKLMDRQQSAGDAKAEPVQTEKAETKDSAPVTTEDAPVQITEEAPVAAVEDIQQLEQQMTLAAMAMLQNPVVPVEQVMEPTPVEAAAPEAVTEVMAGVETLAPDVQEASVEMAEGTVQIPEGMEMETEAVLPETAEVVQETAVQPQQTEETPQQVDVPEEAVQMEQVSSVKVEQGSSEEPQQQSADEEETPSDVPVETQVFKEVREVPIKVGEVENPEKAQDAKPVEAQIAGSITKALESGESKVELQLNPDSLGKVTVEITFNENGTLHIQLHVDSSRTQGLLEKNITNLQQLLSQDGQREVRVEVQHQEESQQQHFQDGRQGHPQQDGQEEGRRQHHEESRQGGEDFLHQLRLGLVPLEGE